MEQNKDKKQAFQQAHVSRRYSVGQKLPLNNGNYLKIMAYADGYYMARYKGCMPFCCRENEIESRLALYGG